LELAGPAGERGRSNRHAQLVGAQGVSVISDIDDTVKVTQVRDKRALMANTFVNPFEAVPSMARAYTAWADGGAVFHYVSSSPWQLYPALAQFFAESGLPAGSFHLREIGLGDRSFLDLFDTPADAKVPTISAIIRRWPLRKFVLVGDSGEQDPEIYARIYREFPGNVLHIFIRNVTDARALDRVHRSRCSDGAREASGRTLR
jgi:phosphatidate phosphatase APP1